MSAKYRLVLGSSSPRRKELLSYLHVPFDVHPFPFDEEVVHDDPIKALYHITQDKLNVGMSGIKQHWTHNLEPFLVVSDTTVILEKKFLGKPRSKEEARQMLLDLSGKDHVVATAVGLSCGDRTKIFHSETKVSFKVIDQYLLDCYIDSGDGLDKAGGYGIQGMAQFFVEKIEGNYSNVVGFPLFKFIEELRTFFGDEKETSSWQKYFA